MRFVECDLCGSSESVALFTHRDFSVPGGHGSFRLVECRGCGLIYLNPRPERSEIAPYYPQNYYDALGRSEGRTARRERSLGKLYKSLRRQLLERSYQYPPARTGPPAPTNRLLSLGKSICLRMERWRLRVIGREVAIIPFIGEGRLLDVGCATGKDLESFKATGWSVSGVEASPYAASVARSRLGCEVWVGAFEEVSLPGESFDVVRFSHSLEHLLSPRTALEKARRILRPSGPLWIELPNAASLERRLFGRHWFGWDLPRHFYHFTPETLTRLLARTGFRPVRVQSDARTFFFAESVANALAHLLKTRPRRKKLISAVVRPLVYALGMTNRGALLTVHATREEAGTAISPERSPDMRPGGAAG